MYPWMFYGSGGHFGFSLGWWLLSMLFGMLIPLILIALVVYFLIRAFRNERVTPPGGADADPLKILKIRYAKGEITREEYDRMKEELRN